MLNLVFLSLSKYYITPGGIVTYSKMAEKINKRIKNACSSVSGVSLAECFANVWMSYDNYVNQMNQD